MIWQTYYREDHKRRLMPELFEPLDVSGICTPYFENSIILQKFAENNDPFFGVLSHAVSEKSGFSKATFQRAFAQKKDVYIFVRQSRGQNGHFFVSTSMRHKNFTLLFDWLLDSIGKEYDWRNVKNYPRLIMYNSIVARHEIYSEYISEYLQPAVEAMQLAPPEIQKLLWEDAGYNSSYISRQAREERFVKYIGVPHYPHHAFLLERLWMVYFMNLEYFRKLELQVYTP